MGAKLRSWILSNLRWSITTIQWWIMSSWFRDAISVRVLSPTWSDTATQFHLSDKQVFPSLEFIGWYTVAAKPTSRHISLHEQVCFWDSDLKPCIYSRSSVVHRILLDSAFAHLAAQPCIGAQRWYQCTNSSIEGVRINYWTPRAQISFSIHWSALQCWNWRSRAYCRRLDCKRGR